jgi:xanthine/CO dehydrogenase XdhC/CoxF family maturation factor
MRASGQDRPNQLQDRERDLPSQDDRVRRKGGGRFQREARDALLDVRERLAAVDRRLTRSEEVEIRTVEDGDSHVFFSPLNQALNCAMSSADD